MSATPKIRWRTAFTFALIIALLMSGLGVYLTLQVERTHSEQVYTLWQSLATQLADDPALLAKITTVVSVDPAGSAALEERQSLATLLEQRAALLGARLTIYATDGRSLADSHLKFTALKDPESMQEIVAAAERPGPIPAIYDALLERNAIIFTRPLLSTDAINVDNANTSEATREEAAVGDPAIGTADTIADTIIGYLQFSIPEPNPSLLVDTIRWRILPMTMLVALIIICMMVFQAERAAYTLRRLTTVAEQITKGDLSARTLSLSGGEVGHFVRAFNRMADKLQRQMQKRAREKDRLHTVLHVMTDGVLLLNRHSSVRLLNDAAAEILKTAPERALRRSFVQTVRDHRIVEVFRRCQASGQTETAVIERAEDSVLRMVVTPFLRGKDRGHLVVLQDLTRIHQLQTARQDFVSNISHELRTPLASLRALVETLSDGALEDPDAAHRFLRHMEVEVDALTQMVQELLELSRIESGKVTLQYSSVAGSDFVIQSCERLQAQANRADVTIIVDAPETLPAIEIDTTRMQQVLTNLIHNAIKFSPTGGTIRVSATMNESHEMTIAVADTGVGIAHEDVSRIFERFYKADRARAGGGTGLGLAIAKHIVQAHGGTIWAESIPGRGSTFYFTVPTAVKPTAETAIAERGIAETLVTVPAQANGAINDSSHDAIEQKQRVESEPKVKAESDMENPI